MFIYEYFMTIITVNANETSDTMGGRDRVVGNSNDKKFIITAISGRKSHNQSNIKSNISTYCLYSVGGLLDVSVFLDFLLISV